MRFRPPFEACPALECGAIALYDRRQALFLGVCDVRYEGDALASLDRSGSCLLLKQSRPEQPLRKGGGTRV